MVDARAISVTLGQTAVLERVTFRAAAGAVTAIVGPNGSGKTTLLRALTGDVPYTGQVMLNGSDIARQKPWELADTRAVLPQASALAFPFTVLEVVQIGLHSSSAGDASEIPMQALIRVGLGTYAHRLYQELSGGEQQRVQLARVLSQVWAPCPEGLPRWLFLDEPVSALDIAHQLQVMQIAKTFAEAGGGVVTVMHDLNLTAMFADHIAVMSAGKIAAFGPPNAVMTDDILSRAYGCHLQVGKAPPPGTPFLLPHAATYAVQ